MGVLSGPLTGSEALVVAGIIVAHVILIVALLYSASREARAR